MPVKVFNFLPTPLNKANDRSSSGFANLRTGQETNAGGLVLGDAIDLTSFEAAGLSSPIFGALYEGRYRRVQVAAGATAANIAPGTAAFVAPGSMLLAVQVATPGSGQTPGTYQVHGTSAAPAAAGGSKEDHPKDGPDEKAPPSVDTHHDEDEDEDEEDRKPAKSAGTRYDSKVAKKLKAAKDSKDKDAKKQKAAHRYSDEDENYAGPEHEKAEGGSQVPGPPATEKAKAGPAAAKAGPVSDKGFPVSPTAAPPGTFASGVGSGAVIQVVVGPDGTVSQPPTVVAAGSGYTSPPTFTLSAGGTAATFQGQMVVNSYIVTDAATPGINLSQGRGVFLNAITPGNYGWIQENGIASFQLGTAAGAAGGLLTPDPATGLFNATAVAAPSPVVFGTTIDTPIAGALVRGLMTLPVWNG